METVLFKLLYKPLVRSSAHKVLQGRLRDVQKPEKGHWTRQDVNRLLAATWCRVDDMLPQANLPDLPTRGSRHNVFLAVVTTAAYRELAGTGTGQEYASLLIADTGWKLYALGVRIFSLPFRLVSSSPATRLECTIRLLMKFPFSAPGRPAYEARVWKQGDDLYTHWTWCPPQAYVRKLVEHEGDKGELDAFYQSWCQYDWPGADMIAGDGKKGHYQRRLTLSEGDRMCDMCWKAKGR